MSDFDIPSAAALRDGLRTMIDERDAELARLRAALAEVTAERDALIERWPESDLTSKTAIGLLVRIDGNWYFDSNGDELSGPYPTREMWGRSGIPGSMPEVRSWCRTATRGASRTMPDGSG
jgi:hypothetical protein